MAPGADVVRHRGQIGDRGCWGGAAGLWLNSGLRLVEWARSGLRSAISGATKIVQTRLCQEVDLNLAYGWF